MPTSKIDIWLQVFFVGLLSLTGCASVKETANGTYETGTTNWDGSIATYRVINQKNANEKCASQGKLVDPIAEGNLSGVDWVLRFKCVDPAVKQQRDREALEAKKREQDRRNQLAAEQEAKEQRKRKEEEAAARRQAQEWERTRPQREAEWKRQEAEENSRLNRICPVYSFSRQTCATATFYKDCMNIRMGNSYREWDDQRCQNR